MELATISFGQRFEVTPIQMITMVSSIANEGRYVHPRLVKEIKDSRTGEVTILEPQFGEQAISKETANSVLDMMGSVVSEGTGKNAKVQGYNIGGKTGTSEDGVNTNKYVTSFIGVATIDEPIATILITLYNPTGEGGHQGGGVAAPIAGKVFSEILPYLNANKNEEDKKEIEMPDVNNIKLGEAEKILSDLNINVKINSQSTDYNKQSIVTRQIPDPTIKITEGSNVILYVE
ncbi:MAG: PASTA domain-containing protein [Clostridia bacterium]|nr:PASTA domain-containing protein [Clostridia bacterium]